MPLFLLITATLVVRWRRAFYGMPLRGRHPPHAAFGCNQDEGTAGRAPTTGGRRVAMLGEDVYGALGGFNEWDGVDAYGYDAGGCDEQ